MNSMQLDKNGCGGWMDIYCWKCSEYNYSAMGNSRGKGRMKFMKRYPKEKDLSIYKCVDCNYQFEYELDYVKKYAIR